MGDWDAAAVPPRRDARDDDWRYVPRALRPLRARGVLAGLVILFAAGLALTMALPAFSR